MTNLSGTYVLDKDHSEIGFIARHAMITKVRGKFEDWEASFTFDAENPANSKSTATIKADSFSTGNKDRDAHVKSEDFFDVEKYPEITFNATSFNLTSEDEGTVTGDLTIKGTTKPVTLDVEVLGMAEDQFGNTRLGFEANTKINRLDFGIDFNAPLKTGGVLLSEEIKIQIEGSAIKQEA